MILFTSVTIKDSPSIMLKGMEGSTLGVWAALGEGRAYFPDDGVLDHMLHSDLAPLRYCDDDGSVTEAYPFNLNGSPLGIAAICSPDRRYLAMMPHPDHHLEFFSFLFGPLIPWMTWTPSISNWAEEAKLIIQLDEMEATYYSLFEQAYDSSLDVSRSLHHYEMSKLLSDQYDGEGACMVIKSGSRDTKSQMWTEQVVSMYIKWAEKLGQNARVAETLRNRNGVSSATIEFEFEFAYGYLLGERGVHRLITSSTSNEVCSASVEIIPLFLRASPDFEVKDEDLSVSYPAEQNHKLAEHMVRIQHLPSGITVESSGERNRFANRIKALNRLKAKLLVIANEQKVSDVYKINSKNIVEPWRVEETRRYVSKGQKMVVDLKTGLEILDLNSVLDGNIGPLLGAHIGMRRSIDAI